MTPELRVEIEFSDAALADFTDATDWYLSQLAFDAASGLADELDAALLLLVQFPASGVPRRGATRVLTLPKFPFSLIYRVGSGRLRIIAVAHHSRRPGFWNRRR